MQTPQFEIRALTFHWITEVDDAHDLCAHGEMYVRIGEKVMTDNGDDNTWTLSAAALNLMRTLETDYEPGDFAGQLIPCCGFNMFSQDDGQRVYICGCGLGIDWTVRHEGNHVRHITGTVAEAIIDFANYRDIVINFAEIVERFYKNSLPRILPADNSDREGYEAFWNEWRTLKRKWQ